MRKLLLSCLMLLGMGMAVSAAEVKTPIKLTGGTNQYTIVPLEGSTLEDLYGATFTPLDNFQNAFQYKNFETGDNDKIVIKFGSAVPSGWHIHTYGGQFDGNVNLGGKTEYEIDLTGANMDDFTIFNWDVMDPITITECYFVKETTTNTKVFIENPANLEEIPQEQDQVEDGTIHKASVSGPTDGVTTYTTTDGICIIVKTLDVNVADCDYITYKFAEPIPAGIQYAVWSKEGNKCVPLDAGITEFKYVFAEDAACAIAGDVIPQVSLVTVFAQAGKIVKVKGIYKHKISETTFARTYSFDQALDFTDVDNLEAYVATAFTPASATLTLSKVTKVPANTGLYLVGKDGNYKIPTTDSASPIATNFLKPSGDGTITMTDGSNTNLVLSGTGANRGFHPLSADGNMGENKAYLQIPTADFNSISAARLNIVFEDETTAIKAVNDVKVADDAWYSINGVKLNAKPTQKGIYLNNGKKFAVE